MLKQLSFVIPLAILLVTIGSCGKSNTNELPPETGSTAPSLTDVSTFTATISGEVVFDGTPPPSATIQMSADPYCASHDQDSAKTQEVVVNPNGTLSNVIVYLKSGFEGMRFATPKEPVVIDQRNCRYDPHVFTLTVHQPLIIKNNDATLHNIHIWTTTNPPFNVGQPVQHMESTTTFDKPEIPVAIRCDVHKWMNAFMGVFNHPFRTVTHEQGTFELKVPPGKYEIAAWQEKFGEQTREVTVGAQETKTVTFVFSENNRVRS